MITTTLNAIRMHKPCEGGWARLLASLGKTKAAAWAEHERIFRAAIEKLKRK